MNDLLTIALTSTVFATIISSIVSYLISKHSESLKYITNERCEWRKEIRRISEEIFNASYEDIGMPLTRLKLRINAYGKHYFISFEKDSHIWELIDSFEEIDTEEFAIKKMLLINFLSLLLKHDWDRSKEEVIGNKNKLIVILSFMSSMCLLIYFYLNQWERAIDNSFFNLMIIMIVFSFILPRNVYGHLLKEKQKIVCISNERAEKEINNILWGEFAFYIFVFGGINIPIFNNLIKSINVTRDDIFVGIMFIATAMLFTVATAIIGQKRKIYKEICYEKSVHLAKNYRYQHLK